MNTGSEHVAMDVHYHDISHNGPRATQWPEGDSATRSLVCKPVQIVEP